jgi:hypothetical protein
MKGLKIEGSPVVAFHLAFRDPPLEDIVTSLIMKVERSYDQAPISPTP